MGRIFLDWYQLYEMSAAVFGLIILIIFFLPIDYKNRSKVKNKLFVIILLNCYFGILDMLINSIYLDKKSLEGIEYLSIVFIFTYIYLFYKKKELLSPFLKWWIPLYSIIAVIMTYLKSSIVPALVVLLLFIFMYGCILRYLKKIDKKFESVEYEK